MPGAPECPKRPPGVPKNVLFVETCFQMTITTYHHHHHHIYIVDATSGTYVNCVIHIVEPSPSDFVG